MDSPDNPMPSPALFNIDAPSASPTPVASDINAPAMSPPSIESARNKPCEKPYEVLLIPELFEKIMLELDDPSDIARVRRVNSTLKAKIDASNPIQYYNFNNVSNPDFKPRGLHRQPAPDKPAGNHIGCVNPYLEDVKETYLSLYVFKFQHSSADYGLVTFRSHHNETENQTTLFIKVVKFKGRFDQHTHKIVPNAMWDMRLADPCVHVAIWSSDFQNRESRMYAEGQLKSGGTLREVIEWCEMSHEEKRASDRLVSLEVIRKMKRTIGCGGRLWDRPRRTLTNFPDSSTNEVHEQAGRSN